jgi:hypothetical protein
MTEAEIETRVKRLAESAWAGPAQLSLGIKKLIHDVKVEYESRLNMQKAANQDLQGTNAALRREYEALLKEKTH